jgi:acyl-CoA reductase-like NAD-dependent aldehyde dehydrogenase
MTSAIDAARERMATVLFAKWRKRDLQHRARFMRRFADDLRSLPVTLDARVSVLQRDVIRLVDSPSQPNRHR